MRCRELLLVISLWLFGFVPSGALAEGSVDFSTTLWQTEDGLPHNIVQAITQTRDGYLWVGTREGLARFDGNHFEIKELIPASDQPSVFCLLESRDGSLWIGTERSGLFRLHAGQVDRFELPGGTLDFEVYEIQEGGDGAIWIETSHEILRWMNGKMESQVEFKSALQSVQSFCVDATGNVWLLDDKVHRLNGDKPNNCLTNSGSLPHAARSLYREPDGVFWIGTVNGLIRIQGGMATNYRKANGPAGIVSVIFRDSAGNLWIGSYAGLSRFVNGEFINLRTPDEPSYRIYAIYEDREQNLWVGSEEGLTRLAPKEFKTITKLDGLAGNTVVTVCPSRDGSVWISSWGDGLNHLVDGKTTVLTKTNGLSSNFIMAMTESRDGSLWAGADYGGALNCIKDGKITVYGREQGFITDSTTASTVLYEDERGIIWISTRNSLQCWDGKRFTCLTNMNNIKVNALCGGNDGVVWIGTEQGLMQWHDGQFEDSGAENPLLHAPILSMYKDAENNLWIGTQGHGLFRWKNHAVVQFTSEQGLFSESIYAILEDNHARLWLNSSRGIFWLDKTQLEDFARGKITGVTSISYGKSDGVLISGQYQDVTQPAACKSADGRLWFRTTQGVAVVDPGKITINKRPPPVVIQEILADGKSVYNSLLNPKSIGKITLQPGRGELEIHYAALSFRAPEKDRSRYKLQGVDLNWVDAGERRIAFYNNLRPGRYRFQATACNNDGIWNEAGATFELILEPHFWQTWWFLALVIVTPLGIVGGSMRYVTRRRMQRRLNRLEQQNAVERERTRIARDMHDELGAKLTRISFQGATARRHLSNPAVAEQQIVKMSETARELINSLDQIVWAVDPENDTLENLATYICRYAGEFFENTPLRCEFVIPTKLPTCRLSTDIRHNVFLAVKEILNNALKHSGATRIVLHILAHTDAFEVRITDDGRGTGTEETGESGKIKRVGHGLSNLRERLASIQGTFELKSEPGRGTDICLIIPLSANPKGVSSIHPTRKAKT
jgi:ligand-binding sensor domain-containing protein/signal transduction histidine kinase